MATKQSKAAKTRAANAKKKAAQEAAARQLKAILLFSGGLLLLALAVVSGANLWLWFHNLLLGVFSWSAYLVGPLMIFIAVLLSLDKEELPAGPRVWQSMVLVVLVSAALQVFAEEQPSGALPELISSLYISGRELAGGGVLALVLGLPLLKLFDFTGAAITISLLVFVFLMILTGGTLAGIMRGAARPVRRLGEAYSEHKEFRARAAKFDIDVPMDEEPPAPPVLEDEPAADSLTRAKDRLLGAAAKAPPPEAFPPEPSPEAGHSEIDDIVIRAVSGETAAEEADLGARPAKGDTLKNTDFVVPPVDDPPIVELNPGPEVPSLSPAPQDAPPLPHEPDEPPTAGEQRALYSFPPVNLLEENKNLSSADVTEELKSNAERLVDTLKSFGVQTRVVEISRGPAVTRYELQPSAGVKISKITGLSDDIALNLAAAGVRIEAPIPNKSAVGIEVPNKVVSAVTIREVIDSPVFENAQSRLSVALGKDIAGNLTVADLARMPHVLIAGATGSGKSVCINSIIVSLLYKATPDQVKLMMIDPKVVELGSYNGIPHLLVPVVTDPRKAAGALCWAVGEMMNRYKVFSDNNVRDITGFNRLAETRDELMPLPHVVIIIDELSDLMMVCPNEVEDYICRLAQMARAAGMHLVIATQRPSVDVITGIIKANIPSRIAFAVSSQVDSRTILDFGGAEKLLGRGDMLFYPVGSSKPTRVQGCFVTDKEVERVVAFVKEGEKNEYDTGIIEEIDRQAANTGKKGGSAASGDGGSDEDEELIRNAIEVVVEAGLASTSLLQRRLKLGYARAARIVDELELRGVVGPFEGSKPRQVLISKERWYEMKLQQD